MEIGKRIKGLRIEKGLEPHDMALKLAISETTYRRYERNETTPDINMLEKIAIVLDKKLVELLPIENITQNNTDQKGGVAVTQNLGTINQSEKLIGSLENQILLLKEKDVLLKQTIDKLIYKNEKLKTQTIDLKKDKETKDLTIKELNEIIAKAKKS